MLSFLRVIQPLHSQPHAGHPGSHNSCDRPLLLSGDHRPAIWSGSQPGYSDPHRNGHFHTDLYQYIYDHPDSDSDSNLHPDNHRYAHRFADSQCLAYLHLDVDSHVHLHVKPNADSYIHTDIDVNIYFHADFHFY